MAHGLTVSPPNRDELTMRSKPLKSLHLILSLPKDAAWISAFFSTLIEPKIVNQQVFNEQQVAPRDLGRDSARP